ncbi:hypothetical protein SAMN05192562_102202 [Kosakonia arachidis]|uniref:Uncharacterized protein n=1 Tax=Kosakonia arachidis TaxID=551989 RepID=A0A1I7B0P9_9ENTR|nr:hypothetical protein SAMN05192562_102202 [Kosakonia arachidis]
MKEGMLCAPSIVMSDKYLPPKICNDIYQVIHIKVNWLTDPNRVVWTQS